MPRKKEVKVRGVTNNPLSPDGSKSSGRVFSINSPRKWLAAARRKAEVKNFRWHDLRHTFCSRLAMADVPLKAIQVLAGHKTIAMTAKYAHLAPRT